MCGSIANLSTVTSVSVETEESHSQVLSSNCMNKNEHISRCSKITQELEARLKERRQIIEHKTYHQTIQQIDTTERSSDGKTSQTELGKLNKIFKKISLKFKKNKIDKFKIHQKNFKVMMISCRKIQQKKALTVASIL